MYVILIVRSFLQAPKSWFLPTGISMDLSVSLAESNDSWDQLQVPQGSLRTRTL